jgi:DNA topoisomerase-1
MTRLRRIDPKTPGISRRRSGRGFSYTDARGVAIADPEILARIRGLAIPPAWRDVWICPDERGHIQAIGVDDAGRRQYLYHPDWRKRRDKDKFARMEQFAEELPAFRERTARDLRRRGMPRERALACAARLLDRGLFRIGSEGYTERNGSFGLATLRKDHTVVRRDAVAFDFVGKSGKRHILEVQDPAVLPVLRALRRRRNGGEELLAYLEGDTWRDVRSADINAYLKDALGDGFSAKDFRTWHATVLAGTVLAERGLSASHTAAKRTVSHAVRDVAEQLGNTPAVCRASYIDPRIIDAYLEGSTIELPSHAGTEDEMRAEIEAAVLALVRGGRRPAAAAA